jgi:hypothetical protein
MGLTFLFSYCTAHCIPASLRTLMQLQMNLIGKIANRDDVPTLSFQYLEAMFNRLPDEQKTMTDFLRLIIKKGMIAEEYYLDQQVLEVQSYIYN